MTITDFGVAIVNGDSHLSQWICQQRRLDVQAEFCRQFQPYIPRTGTVIDVGACLGDHTMSYAKMVGQFGIVVAVEPNPVAFECLEYNMRLYPQVRTIECALGRRMSSGSLLPPLNESDNLGAMAVQPGNGSLRFTSLDILAVFLKRVDFIKIDAEGSEPEILAGAGETLKRFRPVLLIEVNRPVLARFGKTAEDIYGPLAALGYTVKPCEPHLALDRETLDVLAIPQS